MFVLALRLNAQPCNGHKPEPLLLETGCTPLLPCTLGTTLNLRVAYPYGCPAPNPIGCDPILGIFRTTSSVGTSATAPRHRASEPASSNTRTQAVARMT